MTTAAKGLKDQPAPRSTSPHTCPHCHDIVLEVGKGFRDSQRALLGYTTVVELMEASRTCLFVRMTTAELQYDLSNVRSSLFLCRR